MKLTLSSHLLGLAIATTLMLSSPMTHAQINDRVIAVVDNRAILASDLNQAVSVVANQMQQPNRVNDPNLRREVLNQLILRQAQVRQVEQLGLKADEASLDEAVLAYAKQQGVKSLTALQQQLDSKQTGSYANLRAQIAQDVLVSRLRQQQVLARINISERDIDYFLKSPQGQAALGTQVHTLHFRVLPASADTSTTTLQQVAQQLSQALAQSNDVEALNQQFSNAQVRVAGIDMGYKALTDMPTELSARIANTADGNIAEPILASDGVHVVKVLARQADSRRVIVPEYATRHILIQPNEVTSIAAAEQQIQAIYQRLQQGADFATLANTYSTDPGSRGNGGSLGWVVSGVMVPEFENVMKATPAGQISQPFQSQFGWHVLKVDEVRQSDKTTEMQRRMARQILAERQFNTEADNWLRELRTNTYVDIKDPALR